jgi:hypothetical protein
LPFRIGSTYHFFEQNVVLKNVNLISLDTFAISPPKSQIKNSQQHFKTLDVVGIKIGVIFLNKILSLKVNHHQMQLQIPFPSPKLSHKCNNIYKYISIVAIRILDTCLLKSLGFYTLDA